MIVESQAVILKRFPYSDTSVIAHCFTRNRGKISVMVRGAQRLKSPLSAYFQPANYLELIYYFKENRDLQTLSQASFLYNWIHFQDDLKRLSYALATIEITDKAITDQDPHPELFDELVGTLSYFHDEGDHYNLCFWYYELKLLSKLGFQPRLTEREFPGMMLPDPNAGPHSRDILESLIMANIRTDAFKSLLVEQPLTVTDRRVIGNYIAANLGYHFAACRTLNSLQVLKQLLA